MGATCADDEGAEKVAKVEAPGALAKVAELEQALAKLTGERDAAETARAELATKVAYLEALPDKGKAILKVVEKAHDLAKDEAGPAEELPANATPDQRALALVKAAQRQPMIAGLAKV